MRLRPSVTANGPLDKNFADLLAWRPEATDRKEGTAAASYLPTCRLGVSSQDKMTNGQMDGRHFGKG
jgi:hypothetical protein